MAALDSDAARTGAPTDTKTTRSEAVARAKLLDPAPTERFDRLTRIARDLFGVSNAMITVLDDTHQHVKSHVGSASLPGATAPVSDTMCVETIEADCAYVVEDASADPRYRDSVLVTGDPGIRFYAGYPISAGGRRIGALCLFDDQPRTLAPSDEVLLAGLAILVEGELDPAVEADVTRASAAQRGLLPRSRPELVGWDLAGESVAALDVGGDLFDWLQVDGGLVFFLVDPIGRGSGAAIVSATVRGVMRSIAPTADLVVATQASSSALEDLDEVGSFASLFGAHLTTDTGEVHFTDAGHGLTLVVRSDGSSERLASGEPPLGTVPTPGRSSDSLTLRPGDSLVCISDGVLDSLAVEGDPFEVLTRRVAQSGDAGSAVADLTDRAERYGVRDDATVVVLRRTV